MGVPKKREFIVEHISAPEAIVLSIPHAYQAISHANILIESIRSQFEQSQDLSTPPHFSTFSTSILTPNVSDDDEVEFVRQGFSDTYGTRGRPIVLV